MTECNKCGECCERIYFSEEAVNTTLSTGLNLNGVPPSGKDVWQDIYFVKCFWHKHDDGDGYWCEFYDIENKECTIHEFKPAVCVGFPWYNKEPKENVLDKFPSCAFHADLQK